MNKIKIWDIWIAAVAFLLGAAVVALFFENGLLVFIVQCISILGFSFLLTVRFWNERE